MPMKIRNILCPVDFSETSDLALNYAISLAQCFEANLMVLHVVAPPVTTLPGERFLGDFVQADMAALTGACRERVNSLLSETPCSDKIEIVPQIVCGVPYLEITRMACEIGADMIVMGSHGRSALEHFLIGSTAERVVRKAHCPVLTVKKPRPCDKAPESGEE